jgi:D-glycerate 3-kinase
MPQDDLAPRNSVASVVKTDQIAAIAERLMQPLAARLLERRSGPILYGLCGAQGSGKSTLAEVLRANLAAAGVAAAIVSIDDLYLPGQRRAALARDVHPLLRTRGVPGTHDLGLADAVIGAAARDAEIRLPRFDKSQDEPYPSEDWPIVRGPLDVLILEGWCVGARPQTAQQLVQPVNELERKEDADSRWRSWVNAQLGGDYRRLFERLDILALLAAPTVAVVAGWRREQEHDLRRTLAAGGLDSSKTMSDAQVGRFVQFFGRITGHILAEMPRRADVVVNLDDQRRVRL